MSNELIDKYESQSAAVTQPRERLGMPTHVFYGEAVELADFVQRYWQPQAFEDGRPTRPGLSQANGVTVRRLPDDIAQQLVELVAACQTAHQRYLVTLDAPGLHPMVRGRRVLSEIAATLEYLLDDGGDGADHLLRARLAGVHADPGSHDAMALALSDFAELADRHRTELEGLAGFSGSTIDEARWLATALRQHSAAADNAEATALRLRNQLWTLLFERVRSVRAAARLVFRERPAILREAQSQFLRRRRAAAKKAGDGSEEAPGSGDTPATQPPADAPAPGAGSQAA